MKRILLGIFVLFVFASFASAQLSCEVTQDSCSGQDQAIILCLSDKTNAHAELPKVFGNIYSCPNYPWKVCCTDTAQNENVQGYLSNSCSGEFDYVSYLNDITNAHGSIEEQDPHTIPICLSGLRDVKCGPNVDGECLFALSDNTNAHFEACEGEDVTGDYTKIYCSMTSDKDGDGYNANIDCNDDANYVHPLAEEVGDGIDNDCDGLRDGDDIDSSILPEGWYQLSSRINSDFDYEIGGVTVQEASPSNFFTFEGGERAVISKKIRIDQNETYMASVNSSCDATLQLVFDDNEGKEEEGSFWSFLFGADLENSVTGAGRISIEADSENAIFASILIIVDEAACTVSQPQLERLGRIKPTDYNSLDHPIDLPITGPTSAAACCPLGSCWNGLTCIDNMREDTFKAENVSGEAVYQCVDGVWVFQQLLEDWHAQETGACPDEGQCFVLSSLKGGVFGAEAQSFYDGEFPTCIDDGEYIFDHLCKESTWTSRTKFVAEKLLEVAEGDDYTLYCDNYQDALLSIGNNEVVIAGEKKVDNDAQPGLEGTLSGADPLQKAVATCYDALTIDAEAKRLVPLRDNTCVNNFCVLREGHGDNAKVSFGTTLNKALTDEDSFLKALDVKPSELDTICTGSSDDFIKCDYQGDGDLWYNDDLQIVVFGGQGVSLKPGLFGSILNWLGGLFSSESELSEEKLFVNESESFKDVYLAKQGGQTIRAVKEILPGTKQMLIVEYKNFNTPICDYVENLAIPLSLEVELLEEVSGKKTIHCEKQGDTWRIEIVGAEDGLDFFWQQLSSTLRFVSD